GKTGTNNTDSHMKRKINHIVNLVKNASRKKLIVGAIILIILGYFFFFRGSTSTSGLTTVEWGTVKQEINITGNTKPLESVNLAFEQSGRIAEASVRVGSRVSPGQILARLDQDQLFAERAGQQANVESEEATLEEMKKGSRPEDVQIKQAALATANQYLDSKYQELLDTLNDAYIKTDDAIRKQLDSLFTNDEESNVQISFSVSSVQVESDLEGGRLLASVHLSAWKKELAGLLNSNSKTDLDKAVANASQKLSSIRDFLGNLMSGLNGSNSSSNPQIETYKTNVNIGRTNVSAALMSINGATQDIAAQKLTIKQSEADLNKTLAGNTPQSITAQAAKVKQAQAQVQTIDAQIQKTILRAPFFGVVTRQDAKVGEISSPNTPVISLISEGKLEIEANIPEVMGTIR
ncbi:MAG: biotin/lipoyl-binding protein, partial [Patescibacteria group bacterium]